MRVRFCFDLWQKELNTPLGLLLAEHLHNVTTTGSYNFLQF